MSGGSNASINNDRDMILTQYDLTFIPMNQYVWLVGNMPSAGATICQYLSYM